MTGLIWDAASTSAQLTTAFSSTGVILLLVISTVLVAVVALLGLGFGVRHLRRYITGRKF